MHANVKYICDLIKNINPVYIIIVFVSISIRLALSYSSTVTKINSVKKLIMCLYFIFVNNLLKLQLFTSPIKLASNIKRKIKI